MSQSVPKAVTPRYSPAEERLNVVSHAGGALLALLGLFPMLYTARNAPRGIVGALVYGLSLLLMFLSSTCYHAISAPRVRAHLRVLDHCAIYLLIAGTYTPFVLVSLQGALGWTIFMVIWTAALLGVALNRADMARFARLSLALYVVMGWAVVFVVGPLLRVLEPGGIVLLALGGVLYTLGIPFYVRKNKPWTHGIWHLFVLAGAAAHYFAILFFVLPQA